MGDTAAPETPAGTCLILLTNVYPFAPGEEFIEAEIDYLAEAFDRVLVIPVMRDSRHSRRRETPKNVEVILPQALSTVKASILQVLRFTARHPVRALASVGRALRSFPQPKRMFVDLRLDLLGGIVASQVEAGVRAQLRLGMRTLLYGYWLMVPARAAVHLSKRLRRRSIPVISRAHGYDVFSERDPLGYLPQRELLLAHISRVFTASRNGAEHLRAEYPSYADRIETGHLGVAAAVAAGNASRASGKVYTCAYLVPLKRIPLLIEGIALAQRRGLNLTWSHIGSGPDDYAAQIEQLAADQLSPGSYEFLGNLSNDQVRQQYASNPGGVFVNVSETEGVPVSIMEAIAQGLPIIATDVGGNSELIDVEGGMFDGLLASDPTPEQIADRLETLFAAPDVEYDGFVRASLAHWRREWSSDANYTAFSALLADAATSE